MFSPRCSLPIVPPVVHPRDPRIDEYWRRRNKEHFTAEGARFFATEADVDIEFEELLPSIWQPVLVIAGRHDRATPLDAAQAIVQAVPRAKLVVFVTAAIFLSWRNQTPTYTP